MFCVTPSVSSDSDRLAASMAFLSCCAISEDCPDARSSDAPASRETFSALALRRFLDDGVTGTTSPSRNIPSPTKAMAIVNMMADPFFNPGRFKAGNLPVNRPVHFGSKVRKASHGCQAISRRSFSGNLFPLPRARITAKTVFNGKIEHTESLREPQVRQFQTGGLRLPFWAWRWTLRVSWIVGHRSQRLCRDEFKARVTAVAERLIDMEQDILVVSHAGMMAYLSAELRRRGFSGPSLRIAETAKIYIYERNPLS